MRLGESPFVLAFWGTVAIHTLILVAADALVVTNPRPPPSVAPRIEMIDIAIPPPAPPPPKVEEPKVVEPEVVEPEPEVVKTAKPVDRTPRVSKATAQPQEQPQPQPQTSESAGGAQVVQMPDLVPTKDGVAVKQGASNNGQRTGKGGTGGRDGAGSGSGTADAPPPPVSVATIKTKALPKGDYGYINAARDYPPEARRLGIEGQIKVRLVVDATGKVTSATLINRLGHGLDELALAKAREIQFEPARDTNDRAVTSLVIWTFSMTLPK